ncbi:tyrosine-type recombinase/integrase [Kribbella sancticallisti]|uniref:tyrosine-type recombinase/integrase n=1 Tax=Kribbella sancticallisti TaxID=460087 RepID=UPI0031D76A1D
MAAGIRNGRLHDARHAAATVLLMLAVPERAVMDLMGWPASSMVKRYQHITAQIRDGHRCPARWLDLG